MNWTKFIGIFLVYGWVIFGVFYFEWRPSTVLISYLLELAIMACLFSGLKLVDLVRTKSQNSEGYQFVINYLLGTVILILFQSFFIFFMLGNFEELLLRQGVGQLFFNWEVFVIAITIGIVYCIRLVTIKGMKTKLFVLQGNFAYQLISFTLVNTLGIVALSLFPETGFTAVLLLMVIIRLLLEVMFSKVVRLI